MSRLEYNEETVYVVDDWGQVQQLAAEFFSDPDFSLPAALGCQGITIYYLDTERFLGDLDKDLLKARARYAETKKITYGDLESILQYYAREHDIRHGNYLLWVYQ